MIIGVRFKKSNGGWSAKIYDFSVNRIRDIDCSPLREYNIKTSDGYTYRDAKVCFVHREPDLNRELGLKKIIAVRKLFGSCNYWLDTTIPDEDICSTTDSIHAVNVHQTGLASASSSAEQVGTALKELSQRLAKTPISFGTIDTNTLKAEKSIINIKGEKNMFNFEFGKAIGVCMSIYGVAFKTEGNNDEGIAYKDGGWVEVPKQFLLNYASLRDMLYVMPVAKKDVKVNDFIKHNNHWCRVAEVTDTTLKVEDVYTKTIVEILPTRSPFGFDFYSKLVNLFDGFGFGFGAAAASEENPFGNIGMMMMLANGDMGDNLLPLMMMSGGKMDMSNPMMMYFLLKK